MQEVSETVVVKLDAPTAWIRVGDFRAVGDWHPLIVHLRCDGNAPGNLRRATRKDGSSQLERLDARDNGAHVYSYTLLDTTLPLRDYHAEFRVDAGADGTSTIIWSARFDAIGNVQTATEIVRKFL